MKRLSHINGRAVVMTIVVIAVASCARISSPTGGPRDTKPPAILESVPSNGTKMFTGKTFSVTFDEFVVLDKINEKFMVSPPMAKKPDIVLKGKKLVVSWDESLADSTTYTFYFQDAIRDNNEGNILNNYSYVLSTGSVIDSLSLSGNVFNAATLEAENDVLVMLYSNLSDTAPSKTLPAYITKPDLSGGFTVSNMRPGSYRLYALNDLNGNKMFDGGDESFAFYDSVINVTPSGFYGAKLDSVRREVKIKSAGKGSGSAASAVNRPDIYTFGKYHLFLFTGASKKQYLTSSERGSAGSLLFTLALPADTATFDFSLVGVSDTAWYKETSVRRDTFRIWITDPAVYGTDLLNALVRYPYTDSTNTLIYKTDTVRMRFITREARSGKQKLPALKMETNIIPITKPGTRIWFRAATPLTMPDTSRILLEQTRDTVKTYLKPFFRSDTLNSRRIYLGNHLTDGASYSLVFKDDAVSDIYGVKSDSTAYRFRMGTTEEYCKLTIGVTGYEGNVVIQLLNEKEDVIGQKRVVSPGRVQFEYVDKGRYRLKAIYDLNNDGRYTPGDFTLHRQPEPVSYYYQEIEALVNWEIEQTDWDLGEKEKKDLSLRRKPESKSTRR